MGIHLSQLTRNRRNRHSRVSIEALENRHLLAADLLGGTWFIRGTDASEEIKVSAVIREGTSVLTATLDGMVLDTQPAENVKCVVVRAMDGDDVIELANDIDIPAVLFGQNGDDTIVGGAANDRLYGGSGIDKLMGGGGADRLSGGGDADTIFGGIGNDAIFGGLGHDSLTGDVGQDILFGGHGDDSIFGGDGHDLLYGGLGQDFIAGGMGDDLIVGGLGRDTLLGGEGNNDVRGDLADQITDKQVENLSSLMQELNRIASESEIGAEHIHSLTNAVRELVEHTEFPPEETRQFLHTLESACDDGRVSSDELHQLLAEARAVLEKAEFPSERVDRILYVLSDIADASNVDPSDVRSLVGHIQAIRLEFQRNWLTDEQNASLDQFRTTISKLVADSEVTQEQAQSFFAVVQKLIELDEAFPHAEARAFSGFLVLSLADGRLTPLESFILGRMGRNFFRAAGMSQEESDASWNSVTEFVAATRIDLVDLQRLGRDFARVIAAFSN